MLKKYASRWQIVLVPVGPIVAEVLKCIQALKPYFVLDLEPQGRWLAIRLLICFEFAFNDFQQPTKTNLIYNQNRQVAYCVRFTMIAHSFRKSSSSSIMLSSTSIL